MRFTRKKSETPDFGTSKKISADENIPMTFCGYTAAY
jgi:hypothetical protein